MRWFVDLMLRFRFVVLALLLVAVVLSLIAAPHTRLDMGIGSLIAGDPAAWLRHGKDRQRLPELPPARVYCLLSWPAPITKTELVVLDELGRILQADSGIQRVVSLANVPVLQQGSLLPRPFLRTLGTDDVGAAVARHPLLQQQLLSRDGRSAALLLVPTGRSWNNPSQMLDRVRDIITAQVGSDVTLRLVSGSVADRARQGYMVQDLTRIVGLELLIFSLLLPLLFRTLRGVVLPLLVMVCAVLFNLALLVVFGGKIQVIEIAIPGLIVMIGLCDAVHMLHRFEEARAQGADRDEAIRRMFTRVGAACLVTSLTTAVAFLSLLVTEHVAIQTFALKAAVAVMVTFVVTMVILPVGLALFPAGKAAIPRLPRLDRLGYGRARLTATTCVILLGVASLGASMISVEAKWLEELPDSDPIKSHVAFIDEQFRGAIAIEAGVVGDLSKLATFDAVERVQARVAQRPEVVGCESYTQWIRAANGNPERIEAAGLQRGLTALGVLPAGVFPAHLLRRDLSSARIVFNVRNLSSRQFLAVRDAIREIAAETAPGLEIWPTGYGLIAYETSQFVAETLVQSLLLSLVSITILIMLLFRSFRLGLISILPNAAPVLVALGVNGLLDIPLRIGVVMIYSLGVGLAVDDTVHLITRWRQESKADPNAAPRVLVLRALQSSGSALIVTSTILVVGSLCFLVANFRSAFDSGILLTAIVVAALLLDLFLLPHLLERFGPGLRTET